MVEFSISKTFQPLLEEDPFGAETFCLLKSLPSD